MLRAIIRASDALDRLCRWGAIACLGAMLLFVTIQVVARYGFAQPPSWTEELTRFAMVWGGLLGATIAFKARFDPVLVTIPAARGRVVVVGAGLVAAGAVLIFALPVLYYSLFGAGWTISQGFVARSAGRTADAVGLSLAWIAAAVPFAMATIVVHLMARLAGDKTGLEDDTDTNRETA
jgi:TRAP-type C4-dicarboxylate transport system permease small subunit